MLSRFAIRSAPVLLVWTTAAVGLGIVGSAGIAHADVGVGPGPTNYSEQPQPTPGSCHYRSAANGQTLPDPACTPGAISPKVTLQTLDTTICRNGYSKSIRPPHAITEAEKKANAAAYSYTGPLSEVEYDHLIPLELGGDPDDPANLWVEPNDRPGATTTANGKDVLENRLRQLVCAGSLPLIVAQRAIATDWVAALARYG